MPASKYTPETQALICELIEAGVPALTAVRANGLHHSTHYDWMQRGEAGEEPYSAYTEAVKIAQAAAEAERVQRIREWGKGFDQTETKTVHKADGGVEVTEVIRTKKDWTADAWWLERVAGYTKGTNAEKLVALLGKMLASADPQQREELAKQFLSLLPSPDSS